MKWWNSVVAWLSSSEGARLLTDAILPFIAILLAGVLAALIARGMSSRLLELREREVKAAAVTSLIGSARRAVDWSELGPDEKAHATHLADEASVRLRLLPVAGSGMAASWAEHEIQGIKVNSATFRFQAEQTFADVRDRLIEWQANPARARKLFRLDLDRWKAEGDASVEAADAAGAAPLPRVASEAAAVPAAHAEVAEPAGSAAAPAAVGAGAGPGSAAVAPLAAAGSTPGVPTAAPGGAAAPVAWPTPPATSGPGLPASAAAPPAAPAAQTGAETVAPASPSDAADAEARDADDREPAFSSPVSAHDVRRRTAPDPAE